MVNPDMMPDCDQIQCIQVWANKGQWKSILASYKKALPFLFAGLFGLSQTKCEWYKMEKYFMDRGFGASLHTKWTRFYVSFHIMNRRNVLPFSWYICLPPEPLSMKYFSI